MNIFVTSKCPIRSAQFLDDKRCNKMVLETAQLLSTAVRAWGFDDPRLYKATHKNHPCTKWVVESRQNYIWLLDHFAALAREYHRRSGYKKQHASFTKLYDVLLEYAYKGPDKPLTEFANCAANAELGVSFKNEEDVHSAYRKYLRVRWANDKREPKWYGQVR